jgi:UDP-N-acetylmuramoyl-L-alanyl-D-glutamate--2,6-diaminopimelate ligase
MENSSWKKANGFLDDLKKFPLFKLLYKLSWAPKVYHFILALIGAIIYRFPGRKIKVIGITGTKGKTTTVELVNAVLEAAGRKMALLSSLRVKMDKRSERNSFGNSMPGRFFIQNFLRQAVKEGCEYAIIEVTSQGVVLSRHRFIDWRVAVLTNIAPEHIESHGSFEKYRSAKLAFLKTATRFEAPIFLNRDNESWEFFSKKLAGNNIIPFSKKLFDNFQIKNPDLNSDFYREDIAAAYGVVKNLGISEVVIKKALENFRGVSGRFEFVQKKPFAVIVDYAHTPDSLEAIYKAVRPEILSGISKGKMICVLGSAGGGRDKWKRPAMGKIAAGYCDKLILTDEDPYDENPEEILDQVKAGFKDAAKPRLKKENVFRILDRREALKKAVELAEEGDTVIATGKGSEMSIHVAHGKTIPWNEKEIIKNILGL